MSKYIVQTMFLLMGYLLFSLVHIFFISEFPFPLHHIHIAAVVSVLLMLLYESGSVVWIISGMYYIIDLYAGTPFGIYFISGTIAALCMYWAYKELLTNRSLWAILALEIFFLTVMRLVYTLLIVIEHSVRHGGEYVRSEIFYNFFWEVTMTALLLTVVYGVVRLLFARFRPGIVHS